MSHSDDRFDRALSVLSNAYRRELLVGLLSHNPRDDDDRDPLALLEESDDPEATELEIFHTHLPKLEKMGYIRWDRDTGDISKGPDWEEIGPLLELIAAHREELPDGWL